MHTGILAAAYVSGLQENGVAATIKHFVGNDQEHERTAAESVISDRALREIYLYPCVYCNIALIELDLLLICQVHVSSEACYPLGFHDIVSAT